MANKEIQGVLNVLSNGLNEVWQGDHIIFPKEIRDKYVAVLQQAIDRQETIEKELELYKRAFELSCKDHAFCDIDLHNCEDYMNKYINKAKEELENDRK